MFIKGFFHSKEVSITVPNDIMQQSTKEFQKWNQNLFLLDSSYKYDIFQFIPRKFTITTKNGSSNFNKEMIMSFSQTISSKCNNPENNQINLDIADEENVLDKFSQLFQGKTVSFTDEDLLISYKIVRLLKIYNCPNFMKPYDLQTNEDPETIKLKNTQETECKAVLDFSIFDEFLCEQFKQTFSIITKKKKYMCNIYAVYSSNVIREFLKKNPAANSYKYDIEDENNEFEIINQIFNFERVNITNDNKCNLDKMIKELEISCLYEMIDNFQDKYDQTDAEFNEIQEKIDEINEINSLIHNIDENNYQEVEQKIIKYLENKSEEEIQEFCSFLIQFIKTEYNKTKQELIIKILNNLDQDPRTKKSHKYLMSLLIKQLLYILGVTKSTCSFAYILYTKGIITKDELFQSLTRICKDKYLQTKQQYVHPYKIDKEDKINTNKKKGNNSKATQIDYMTPTICTNICCWFLPDIIQMNLYNDFTIMKVFRVASLGFGLNQKNDIFLLRKSELEKMNLHKSRDIKYEKEEMFKYLDSFLPDKLEEYNQMRDIGEPIDELTRALRNDDVDKLQQILTMNKIDEPEKLKVPYNIFEEYIENGETSYINYSAAYGSLKCFKYLLSNNHKIDERTFKYSIYGGNIEIVKIIEQTTNSLSKLSNFWGSELKSLIIFSIAKHRNDIFDWIINNVYFQKITDRNTPIFKTILQFSAKNSNSHSLIRIFGKGYNMWADYNDLVLYASANGFYKIIQLICLLTKMNKPILYFLKAETSKDHIEYIFPSFFNENLSIFQLYSRFYYDITIIQHIIEYAISREYNSIIKYFFENITRIAIHFRSDFLLKCLFNALEIKNNDDIFYILFNNFLKIYKNQPDYKNTIDRVLNKTINMNKIEMTKEIIQLILSTNPKKDFSSTFAHSVANDSIDLCHYILDNKLYINYYNLTKYFDIIKKVNDESFSIFINNIPPSIKNLFIDINLSIAIKEKNINLIKYLFDQNAKSEFALIDAVKTNDIKIVEIVLEYFDLKLINKSTGEGTALTIAVEKSNKEIVNKLLSIEGIDASLINSNNLTALNIAILNQDDEIATIILDFYGDNLKEQVSQINESIKNIIKSYSKPNKLKQTNDKIENDKENQQKQSQSQKQNQNQQLEKKMIPILKRILEVENIDLNCIEGNFSILSFASKINERNIVEYILQKKQVNVNLRDPKEGNTALIVSIANDNYDIAKMIIENEKTDINISNYKEETALTMSVQKEKEDIIELIINDKRFEPTKSRLNYAFYISSPKISKLLISAKKLDVNYLYKFANKSNSFLSHNNNNNNVASRHSTDISKICTTKLINIASSDKKNEDEIVDLIIQHPTFDKEKSLSKIALFKSVAKKNMINISKKLITLFDINICDENDSTLLVSAVINNNDKMVEFILNDPKFDCNKSLIVYAYYRSLRFNISKTLEKYIHEHSQSVDFNYIFPNGSTIFTAIIDDCKAQKKSSINMINIIKFLCENGADPNKPNKEGKYPLEISMNSEDKSMNNISIALINSNKIDFNVKLNIKKDAKFNQSYEHDNCEYYIHIAALDKNSSILENMLKNKSVDINIPDFNGNSPLMISCQKRLVDNIKLFFTRDDLDFLHRNNEGKDALMLLKKNNEEIEPTQNKEEYLNKLLEYLVKPKIAFNSNNHNKNLNSNLNTPNIPISSLKFKFDSSSNKKPKEKKKFNFNFNFKE